MLPITNRHTTILKMGCPTGSTRHAAIRSFNKRLSDGILCVRYCTRHGDILFTLYNSMYNNLPFSWESSGSEGLSYLRQVGVPSSRYWALPIRLWVRACLPSEVTLFPSPILCASVVVSPNINTELSGSGHCGPQLCEPGVPRCFLETLMPDNGVTWWWQLRGLVLQDLVPWEQKNDLYEKAGTIRGSFIPRRWCLSTSNETDSSVTNEPQNPENKNSQPITGNAQAKPPLATNQKIMGLEYSSGELTATLNTYDKLRVEAAFVHGCRKHT